MINAVKKREGVTRKHPFNTDLLRWMQKELATMHADRNMGQDSMYPELYAAGIFGFFFLLRISELGHLKCGDSPIGTQEGEVSRLSELNNRIRTSVGVVSYGRW